MKFEIGKIYAVQTELLSGTYKVVDIRSDNLKGFAQDVGQVVTYEPLTGNLLEDNDCEFGINSTFARASAPY